MTTFSQPPVVRVTLADGTTRVVFRKDRQTLLRLLDLSAQLVESGNAVLAVLDAGIPYGEAITASLIAGVLSSPPAREYAAIACHRGLGAPWRASPPVDRLPAWTAALTPRCTTQLNAAVLEANREGLLRLVGARATTAATDFSRAIVARATMA